MTEEESEFINNLFSSWKKDTNKRKELNLELVECLKEAIEKYPDQRFGQIISNYFSKGDMDNFFYEEPEETLKYFNNNFN